MQQIERYGVIALLLILVTVIAVTTWGSETLPKEDTEVARAQRTEDKLLERRQPKKNTADEARAELMKRNRQIKPDTTRLDDGVPLTPTRPQDMVKQRANQENDSVRQKDSLPPPTDRSRHRQPGAQARCNQSAAIASAVDERLAPHRTNQNQDSLSDHLARANELQANEDLVVERGSNRKPSVNDRRETQQAPKKSPKKPKSTPSAAVGKGIYVVQSGDTLSGIAQRALGSASRWKEIEAANPGVDPNKLYVGKELKLPLGASATKTASNSKPKSSKKQAAPTGSGRTYTVQGGDMLSIIAQRELGSASRWREIADLNPKVDPDKLFVGAVLKLPAGSKPAATQRNVESPKLATAKPRKKGRVR